MKRKVVCKCGGTHYEKDFDFEENPTWQCLNCYAWTPRQTRKSAKHKKFADLRARYAPRFEVIDTRMAENLGIDPWEKYNEQRLRRAR